MIKTHVTNSVIEELLGYHEHAQAGHPNLSEVECGRGSTSNLRL